MLTKTCLLKDFNLNVQLPATKLIPTLPLRLNYIHWVEDLLRHAGTTSQIVGVDIGCGASCIYCLLAARMNESWKMFALEIDNDNTKYAEANINVNCLNGNIQVIQNEDDSIFNKLFELSPEPKSFCMCNPPFFSSSDEVNSSENRTGSRKRPRSRNSGTQSELIFENGGELGFVRKILNESLELEAKVEIYTTMLGCKKNVQKLLDEIKSRNIKSYTTTEFVQGKTTRWGVAWSFKHNLTTFRDLSKLSKSSSSHNNILTYEISTVNSDESLKQLKEIFNELKIEVRIIEEQPKQCHRWELKTKENTWSNQRRKRRANKNEINPSEAQESSTEEELLLGFEFQHKAENAEIKMFFLSGTMSKDCTNQIMQFIKNKFNKTSKT